MKLRISIILLTMLAIVSCETNELDTIEDSENVLLHVLSSDKYPEEEGVVLFDSRKIVKTYGLSENQKKSIVTEMKNPENYQEAVKRCLFEPVYAVEIDGKLFALLDVKYCPRLMYYNEEGKEVIRELKQTNAVTGLMEELGLVE